jgi:hypothetical protein
MIATLNKKAVCITDDYILGCLISSYFNQSNEFFVIAEPPRMDRLDASNEVIRINNVIAKLKPNYLIFANLSTKEKEALKPYIPKQIIIEISREEDIDEKLSLLGIKFNGELTCRRSDVLFGLLLAKREQKKLKISESAQQLSVGPLLQYNKEHILVTEEANDISNVIAINYAFAIDSSLFIAPSATREEVESVENKLKSITSSNARPIFNEINEIFKRKIGSVDFFKFKCATFITEGLPYGLGIKNVIPICHILRYPNLGQFLFNNIYYENINYNFGSALIFSPLEFPDEETNHLIQKFSLLNFFTKLLIKEKASFENFEDYTANFPYDILHICSHGGEVDGYYTIEKFKDRYGKIHIIEYEEAVGFSTVDENNKIKTIQMEFFKKFDGYEWGSEELKEKKFDYAIEDWVLNHQKKIKPIEIKRTKIDRLIEGSFGIRCYGSFHPGAFHYIANLNNPVIFNNSCVSWFRMGNNFIFAGARCYIGTLWKVLNSVAVEFAKTFYDSIKSKPLLLAFWESNKTINQENYQNIYIFWGTHFSTLQPPPKNSIERIIDNIMIALFLWQRKIKRTESDEVRENVKEIIKILIKVLRNNFSKKDIVKYNIKKLSRAFKKAKLPKVRDSKLTLVDLSESETKRSYSDLHNKFIN